MIDRSITVRQYGHEADLRFVALDGMMSNGFQSWAWDYRMEHGGWARGDGITQVRSSYAGGARRIWRLLRDPVALERARTDMIRLEEEDWERAAADPTGSLPGLARRIRAQGIERLFDELEVEGLSGRALEEQFLLTLDDAIFQSSIVAHEGRHAIDTNLPDRLTSADREFRTKLAEVAFAPRPRLAFVGILSSNTGDATPHGQANLRIMRGLLAWMTEHSREIEAFEPERPVLPQLDLLTDAQLRQAMVSMDPLARR